MQGGENAEDMAGMGVSARPQAGLKPVEGGEVVCVTSSLLSKQLVVVEAHGGECGASARRVE